MDKISLGDFVKRERKIRGLSIQALADLTNLSKSYLSQLENNKRGVSYETANRLANTLKVDNRYLLWIADLYSDEEYREYQEQKKFFDSLSPEELEKKENENYEAFSYVEKLKKFKQRKYVRFEDFLNNNTESIYIADHKLTNEEIKMLIHLFSEKEKNYPSDKEIEDEFNFLRDERKKMYEQKQEDGVFFKFDSHFEYDLD